MFKKIILTSAILATASSVAVGNAASYVGADMGINTLTSKSGSYFRGVPINLFAGYGATVNTSFYLGGEAFLTPLTLAVSRSNNAAGSIRTTYSYGASVLPGVMFSDHTLGYVRAGLVRTYFTTMRGQTKTAPQIGLGMQTNFRQNLDVRAEYVFSSYGNVATAKSPQSDAFKLGFIYKFE